MTEAPPILANSLAAFAELALLLGFIRPRVQGLGGARTWTTLGKTVLAAAAMALAVWAVLEWMPVDGAIVRAGIGVIIGGVVYALVSLVVGADELRTVARTVLRRS